MKLITRCSTFMFLSFLTASLLLAQGPANKPNPNAGHPGARPQTGPNRLTGQANPRASSPAPSRSRVAERLRPERRTPVGQGIGDDRLSRSAESQRPQQDIPQLPPNARSNDPRNLIHDNPREAMARVMRNRLSQIDKIRDKALETGNLDLLDVADRLELDARRKFAEMTERMDQRRELGKPGVGPLVRLPFAGADQQPEAPQPGDSGQPTPTPIPNLVPDSEPQPQPEPEIQQVPVEQ